MQSMVAQVTLKAAKLHYWKAICLSRRCFSASSICKNMEKTFQFQDKLPSLPVPPLAQTCEKYLDSVKPHLTREEFLHTEFLVNEFASGIGKELQRKLELRAKSMRNWLEPWWEDVAYLSSRSPSAPTINIGGPLPITDIWPAQEGTQIKRAALMVHATLQNWQRLYRQEVPVDRMGSIPMCMFQFSRLYSCCKIPGKEKDSLKASFVTAPYASPRHIMVQIRGRIFCCTVLDENMEPLSPPEIEKQLQEIESLASSPGLEIGSLTGADRNVWYELRERLIRLDKTNQKNLETIETSLFALVLDERSPVTETEVCVESVKGDCRNRWFDKSLSILAFKSGRFATHCDHAPFDGIVQINSVYSACMYLYGNGGKWKGSEEVNNYFRPQELVFTVDDVISQGIKETIQKYEETASTMNVFLHYPGKYGKEFIKPFKIHPDTFVQLALQLTYYKLHGKPAATYETAQTRLFYHGRTDTVRSCTVESTAWCKSVVGNNDDTATKIRLFREAYKKHDKLMKDAVNGQGIDRHLLGLQLVAASEGFLTPAIYLDKAWTASGGGANFVLSTSCTGFTTVIGGCAAMVKDGYGAFYSIQENDITFWITTFTNSNVTDANKFKTALDESLSDMKGLLITAKL
ncbi:unnamed protein product [Porites lobata]|uniref:Choline/carnitine acyltransferase domain-containing protein n=1 Tax=Porites lobata TaxID=104759 RepID=A0ABN8R215_9CNID|nr:unnamed protein product [Porites lobata]